VINSWHEREWENRGAEKKREWAHSRVFKTLYALKPADLAVDRAASRCGHALREW
jgi:hypothetical protein